MKPRKVVDWIPSNVCSFPRPRWAATRVFDDGTGEDIAYFFEKKERDEYLKFKMTKWEKANRTATSFKN